MFTFKLNNEPTNIQLTIFQSHKFYANTFAVIKTNII